MGASDFVIFAVFAAILAVLLIGGTILAAPVRRKMVVVANDLYDDKISTDRLRKRIDFLLDTSASPLIAVLLIIASVSTLLDAIFFSDEECKDEPFQHDPRYLRLVELYFGSVLLANPIAVVFLLPIGAICAVLHSGVKSLRGVRLADAQIDRVAHSRLARV